MILKINWDNSQRRWHWKWVLWYKKNSSGTSGEREISGRGKGPAHVEASRCKKGPLNTSEDLYSRWEVVGYGGRLEPDSEWLDVP